MCVVIAPGFSDIFAGNAVRNGILTIALDEAAVTRLLAAARCGPIAVDLTTQTIAAAGETIGFAVDPFRRRCLIEGLDEIALTLADDPAIAAHETAMREATPWLADPASPSIRMHRG